MSFQERKNSILSKLDNQTAMQAVGKIKEHTSVIQANFVKSVDIIVDLSQIISGFHDFILEIETRIQTMQAIPLDDLQNLRTNVQNVIADLEGKLKTFKAALEGANKMSQGIPRPSGF